MTATVPGKTRPRASGASNGAGGRSGGQANRGQNVVPPSRGTTSARRRSGHDPGTTGSWFVSIALVLVVAAASLLARPLFTTASWHAEAIVMVAAVIGAAALVRTFAGGVLWPALASIVAFVAVITVRLAPESVGEFMTVWGREALALVEQFTSDAPPFRETEAAVTGLLVVVGIIAMLCDFFVFALRGRVSAILPVLVFPILPIALGITDVDLWPTIWLAGAFGVYLFATGWWHQRIADDRLADAGYLVDDRGMSGWFGALVMGAAGLVVAIVAAFVVPAPPGIPWIMPNPGAALSTNRANPILDLGDDLRRSEPVPVLEYATSISDGQLPYLSLVTLTGLDAESEWSPGDFASDASTEGGGPLPAPAGLSPEAPVSQFGANIILEQGVSAFLPHPGEAQSVRDLSTTYGYDSSTGDLREQSEEALAQHYEYTGLQVQTTPELIAAAQLNVPESLGPLTEVPGGEAGDRIRGQLEGIVDASASPYVQAQQVRAYLTSEAFTYSETAPVEQGFDGSNLDVTAQFLDAKSGYCVHFSSAMAVMARMLGIPARVQVGFTPGTPISVNEQGQVVYQVSSDDLHAWAELWVDGYGWVPFEATPSSGISSTVVPDMSAEDPAAEATTEPSEAQPQPGEDPSESAPPAPDDSQEPGDEASDEPEAEDDASWAVPTVLIAVAIGLIVLLALAAPMLARFAKRSRRRSIVTSSGAAGAANATGAIGAAPGPGPSTGPISTSDPRAGRGPAAVAWRELLDEAADHGASIPKRADARLQEARLAELASPDDLDGVGGLDGEGALGERDSTGSGAPSEPEVRAALDRLRVAVERAAFDRPDAPRDGVEWADVELVERGIRAGATTSARVRAVLVPASLPLFRILARRTKRRVRKVVRDAKNARGASGDEHGDEHRSGEGRGPGSNDTLAATGTPGRPEADRGDRA